MRFHDIFTDEFVEKKQIIWLKKSVKIAFKPIFRIKKADPFNTNPVKSLGSISIWIF